MPKCQNCGAHVTQEYVRVLVPDEVEEPRACPRCPDLKRDPVEGVREKRAR